MEGYAQLEVPEQPHSPFMIAGVNMVLCDIVVVFRFLLRVVESLVRFLSAVDIVSYVVLCWLKVQEYREGFISFALALDGADSAGILESGLAWRGGASRVSAGAGKELKGHKGRGGLQWWLRAWFWRGFNWGRDGASVWLGLP